MPLGFERLNERTQRPNANINFIKTVSKGADKAIAEEFLARIAAQCYPVMKKHYITVMALEEYPPNPEFLGRNFNAGEVIQLVLKDKQGRWLSFKFVQMVMMHELAHCKQMNHSKFFWAIRNEYAKEMEGLWQKRYEGEGMWGRGRGLQNGAFVDAQPPDNTQIPEHLCGGTYRRRGRKRKRGAQQGQDDGEKLSYAERQQKRIQKKLGKHGVSMKSEVLGDDELTRGALETMNGGKRGAGKPRVANSKRGRELRANAALARFDALKEQTPEKTPEPVADLDSETESEWEDGSMGGSRGNGPVIKDEHGRDMVKVCGDGEDDDEGAGREMDELRMLSRGPARASSKKSKPEPGQTQDIHEDPETESGAEDDSLMASTKSPAVFSGSNAKAPSRLANSRSVEPSAGSDSETEDETEDAKSSSASKVESIAEQSSRKAVAASVPESESRQGQLEVDDTSQNLNSVPSSISEAATTVPKNGSALSTSAGALICTICSLENEPNSPTCVACAHVLCPRLMPNNWACKSDTCKDSLYINAGDVGRCGICGGPKPQVLATAKDHRQNRTEPSRPTGLTGADVLRWD
ncbi:hypothetical protein CKM354_001083500 [Cercospora kikuchii]|uniref:WLM domain-containing protein n=1 Tax=Cercospora kikuchii TaxID=84275 RepID=A0A9P3CVZ3_9PEZI|nr:uncharacterized protein CKM354_001083500 [Cercospora kikuchii]GIZ47750.1 hypothetical protein CKM354_001083500 [Cercospora kikuchii]